MGRRGIRTFDEFRDEVAKYRLPRILLTALDLKLFTVMGPRPWTIPALAKELDVSERGLEILCRNLAAAGLLAKQGVRYRAMGIARTTLNAAHPAYRGGYLELLRNQWEDWTRLTEVVRRGVPVDRDEPDDPEWRRSFTWAMHHRSLDVAPRVVAQVNVSDAE
ncbi:MAG: methyltransferase family protein, partial [Nitrospirales bacterium]